MGIQSVKSLEWLKENMIPYYPLGNLKTQGGGISGAQIDYCRILVRSHADRSDDCICRMLEEKEVTWMPSYGPEMRGGTANCTVIVSDKK